ncbi:hypothetical protein HK101_008514 [Irineochytrium annulatum]|nr:hypothetical protein HK101_008514 [Irineochytrium annulatum]
MSAIRKRLLDEDALTRTPSVPASADTNPSRRPWIVRGRNTVLRWFIRILQLFMGMVLFLTFYMTIRDPGDAPSPLHIPIAHPFSRLNCYVSQMKFLFGLFLFMDRIRNHEPCSDLVRAASVDPAVWPPAPRIGHKLATICPTASLATAAGSNGTVPPSMPPPSCGLEWVVYSTNCNLGLNRLAENLHNQGVPLTILGLGKGWRGWGQRVRTYHDYLISIPHDRLAVLSDAEDVILAPSCSAEVIEDRFRRRAIPTAPILAAAETVCWPDAGLWSNYSDPELVRVPDGVRDPRQDAGRRFHYLNAGTMMGRAGDLRRLLRRVYKDDCVDDQKAFTASYLGPDQFWVEDGGFAGADDDFAVEPDGTSEGPHRSWVAERAASWVADVEKAMMVADMAERDLAKAELAPGKNGSAAIAAARTRFKTARGALADIVAAEDVHRHPNGTAEPNPRRRSRRVQAAATRRGGPAAPAHARPLLALDFDNEVFAAMYGVEFRHLEVDGKAGTVTVKETKGRPCILHQNGRKVENRVLDEVAREFGLRYSESAVQRAKGFGGPALEN